ncbi:hypothetical protein [Helicobacter sp. UBA3407]|uniref:hypothetical protein n=1 Tax=Helicobacter TaxID=209 RepID=UPI00261621AF|nr:hypothetical protein [Helicobacter sp. UBA3407]
MALREYLRKTSRWGGLSTKIAVFEIHLHSIGDCVVILCALYVIENPLTLKIFKPFKL